MNGAKDVIYKVGVMSYIQLFRDHICEDKDTVDAVLDIVRVMT